MHTIKPGTPEHKTPAEHQGTREYGTLRNSGGTTEHKRNTPEYQRNISIKPAKHP